MKKIGLALIGGGAKGAYQLGAWKAFNEFGITFDAYSGVSVGSLNAAMMACNLYDKSYNLWFDESLKEIINLDHKVFDRLKEKHLKVINEGLVDSNNLKKVIEENIDYECLKSKNVYVSATVVGDEKTPEIALLKRFVDYYVFNKSEYLEVLNLKEVDKEHAVHHLLASCSMALVYRPVVYKGKKYYDGGYLDNTVYQPLLDEGCDEVIVVDLYRINVKRIFGHPKNVHYIYPSRGLGSMLNFSIEQNKKRFELGYQDTIKFLEKNHRLFK
jgi:NTE family protein